MNEQKAVKWFNRDTGVVVAAAAIGLAVISPMIWSDATTIRPEDKLEQRILSSERHILRGKIAAPPSNYSISAECGTVKENL